jgi:hypothetical protein
MWQQNAADIHTNYSSSSWMCTQRSTHHHMHSLRRESRWLSTKHLAMGTARLWNSSDLNNLHQNSYAMYQALAQWTSGHYTMAAALCIHSPSPSNSHTCSQQQIHTAVLPQLWQQTYGMQHVLRRLYGSCGSPSHPAVPYSHHTHGIKHLSCATHTRTAALRC